MFTGIIEETGKIAKVQKGRRSSILTIEASLVPSDGKPGDSIAVNGVCLTATAVTHTYFTADVMHETLDRSSLGKLHPGCLVNLERAMKMDGRFGGHIVTGHIDGTGTINKIEKDDNAVWYTVEAGSSILKYIIEKGSVAVDGISLTVARVSDRNFQVSVIPHTAVCTTLSTKKAGDTVNLENDCIGKYVEKLLGNPSGPDGITREFLTKFGY